MVMFNVTGFTEISATKISWARPRIIIYDYVSLHYFTKGQYHRMRTTLNKDRPKYLNLLRIRLPITGVLSIAHRLSGGLLVVAIPFFIYLLSLSLGGAQGFTDAQALLNLSIVKWVLLITFWALMHHFLAGIRFLLLDIDIGHHRTQARQSAWVVFIGEMMAVLLLLGWLL